jgi:proteasome lid subunit RPN8/RPN11
MDKLIIPIHISKNILEHVSINIPEESCGLLAGHDNKVTIEIPITNQLHSPIKYFMDPMELLKALETIETLNLDLLGIFHSHPKGPPIPSETDIKEFLYPGVATIICYPESNNWKMKAFLIENNCYTELALVNV